MTFVRSGKVDMIFTFQRNRHFRQVLVKKLLRMGKSKKKKKTMSPRHSAYILSRVNKLAF